MMKLYYFMASIYSHKVLMALHTKDVVCELQPVRPYIPEERAAHRENYPLGRLPLLEHDGKLIGESSFIVEYLDGLPSEVAPLIPEDPKLAFEVRRLDRHIDNYMSGSAVFWFFEGLRPEGVRDSARIEKAVHEITQTYKLLNQQLSESEGQFLVGECLSLADLSLMTSLRVCQRVVPVDDYPALIAFMEHHNDWPVFVQVKEQAKPAMEAFMAAMGAR